MRGWLLASIALLGCSPFEGIERDRAADLVAIAARPPARRAQGLRDRVLRDELNARIRSDKAYAAIKDPVIDALAARLPLTLAEDYVALGDALALARDRDGALAAYEDALVVTSRAGSDPAHAPVRQAAFRGEATTWKVLGQDERGNAASILADAETHRAPRDRAAFVLRVVLSSPMPGLSGLASAPVLAGASAGSPESVVATELGDRAVGILVEALELLRSGAPTSGLTLLAAQLVALAPPPPPAAAPSPAPAATDVPATPPPVPSAAPPAPPAPVVPAPATNEDVAARLKKLDELHNQKVITDAEYARERARVLREGL